MAKPPYRALRIVLRIFSILIAAGSLLMIFSGKLANTVPLIMANTVPLIIMRHSEYHRR